MKPSWAVVALVFLAGCGSATHAVRLDTGQGTHLVLSPRSGQESVSLREDEFRQSMGVLARDVRPSSRPVRLARQLMFESWQEAVYLEWTGRRLVPAAPESHGPRLLPEQDELTRGYGRWCERNRHPGDCLSLLKDTPTLDADGRYTLAMAIAVDSVWDETKAALAEMADPESVRASIVSALAMYMMLWVLPEPVSKGLAATLTAALIAYLGVDTVWGLIGGWVRLVDEVDRASSFEELREAGERYGKVMGRHAARAFVLLATAAIGNTAGLAAKGPGLPGYSRAVVLAEAQGGFRLAAVGEVRSVTVSAEGSFTIALAPGAVAMTAGGGASNGGELHWDNWKSQRTFGHTFSRHGHGLKNASNLRGRAAGTTTPQGQWTDNEAAASFLKDVRPGLDGPAVIPIPEGMGQVIMPDGSILPARHALVVPKASGGIETAYPVLGPR